MPIPKLIKKHPELVADIRRRWRLLDNAWLELFGAVSRAKTSAEIQAAKTKFDNRLSEARYSQ